MCRNEMGPEDVSDGSLKAKLRDTVRDAELSREREIYQKSVGYTMNRV